MIRTHLLKCTLPRTVADGLNLISGAIYTDVLVAHWRTLRKQDHWLSIGAASLWSDSRLDVKSLHSHSIDAAQQGFYKACAGTRILRNAGIQTAKFPYHRKKYRTTIWKKSAIYHTKDLLKLVTGRNNDPIYIKLPTILANILEVMQVRLVFDQSACHYVWHIVVEDGKKSKLSIGSTILSIDLGEIHPAVIGNEHESTIITCRERRHEQQGHAKRSAKIASALSKTIKDSRRNKRLRRTRARMNAKHKRVIRDMEHKISRTIVNIATEKCANTLVIGNIKHIANHVQLGKKANQKISGWNHGQIRRFTEYKSEEEGIKVKLQHERYTSQTCPQCGAKHKPRGRNYICGQCGFSGHRDVVGQINILSAYLYGEPGKICAPKIIKHRMPHNLRLMRRRHDIGLVVNTS